jgi:hypothetical protein
MAIHDGVRDLLNSDTGDRPDDGQDAARMRSVTRPQRDPANGMGPVRMKRHEVAELRTEVGDAYRQRPRGTETSVNAQDDTRIDAAGESRRRGRFAVVVVDARSMSGRSTGNLNPFSPIMISHSAAFAVGGTGDRWFDGGGWIW